MSVIRGQRPCEAEHCQEAIPSNRVFCPAHWGLIPEGLQMRIVDSAPGTDRDLAVLDAVEVLRANDRRRANR